MPNLLRKKRRSSTSLASTAIEAEVKHDTPPPTVVELRPSPPSPSSSKTAFSTRSSISFSLPATPKRRGTGESGESIGSNVTQEGSPASSLLNLKSMKLTPIKTAAKKVKRQIQRLDDALHQVTSSGSSRRGSSDDAEDPQRALGKSRSRLHPSNIFPPRKRTLSSNADPSKLKKTPPRNRTISCPVAFQPPAEHSRPHRMASESFLSPLSPLHEESGAKGAEGLDPSASDVFGSTRTPAVQVEEDVPDPFLIDGEGDALSSEDGSTSRSSVPPPPALDVSLSPLPDLSTKPLPTPTTPNVNKDVPPPPLDDDDDEDEDEVPELYLPGLVIPTMFLPIPNSDPLTILLNKYIYPPEARPHRDVTGDWQHSDFHTLVMTNSWRALAKMAKDRIMSSDPEDLSLILGLWHLRLSCLARLRLFNHTAVECTNLFTVLNTVEPPEARTYLFERLLPFELEVMQTRLQYWAKDHIGYLDSLAALLRKCKINAAKQKDGSAAAMWKERGARVALIIASQMVEMEEFTAAARLLEPLCLQGGSGELTSPALRSAVARIYLQGGNLHMAKVHFAAVEKDESADERQKRMNKALMAAAEGEWAEATGVLREVIEEDGEDYVAVNNLAVALLNQGKLKEGIQVLESALKTSPSAVVVAEPFLFNLSTLYELRSNIGFTNKRELLVEVAKWSGDGLKTACLKLPSNQSSSGGGG